MNYELHRLVINISLRMVQTIMIEEMSLIDKCKICLENVNMNDYPKVIRPCQCNSPIHRICYDEQMRLRPRENCDVCDKPYLVTLLIFLEMKIL